VSATAASLPQRGFIRKFVVARRVGLLPGGSNRGNQPRSGIRRRHRRRNSGRLRTKAQLLQRERIQLARRIQAVRTLEVFHRPDRGIVPCTIRSAVERSFFAERLLNLRNPVASRGLLPPLLPASAGVLGRPMRLAGCRSRGRLRCLLGLLFRRASAHTRACRYQQRQAQVNSSSQIHTSSLDFPSWTRSEVRDTPYCLLSAGTTPGRKTVKVWSFCPRRRTLNTTFCPGLSLATAFL
jgi:hypothetical protein